MFINAKDFGLKGKSKYKDSKSIKLRKKRQTHCLYT